MVVVGGGGVGEPLKGAPLWSQVAFPFRFLYVWLLPDEEPVPRAPDLCGAPGQQRDLNMPLFFSSCAWADQGKGVMRMRSLCIKVQPH